MFASGASLGALGVLLGKCWGLMLLTDVRSASEDWNAP